MANANASIYARGLFEDAPPPGIDPLKEMQAAGFGSVLFWALHVQPNGDFHYNNAPAVQNGTVIYDPDPANGLDPAFPEHVRALKQAGATHVMFSLGSDTPDDFDNIKTNFEQAMQNFKALASALDITGIDFDYEGEYDTELIVALTVALDEAGLGVTYCPYKCQDFWLGCLAGVHTKANRQIVRCLNLQCYSGGNYNDPAAWVSEIANSTAPLGIDRPGPFVVPGYSPKGGDSDSWCPCEITKKLQDLGSSDIESAFIWNSKDVFANQGNSGACPGEDVTLKGYAEAIEVGIAAASD